MKKSTKKNKAILLYLNEKQEAELNRLHKEFCELHKINLSRSLWIRSVIFGNL